MDSKMEQKELHQSNDPKNQGVIFQDMSQLPLTKKSFKIVS